MPYLTAEVAGVGGIIKQRPDDFLVDERPRYLPCGQGEHLYLQIQRSGQTTLEVVRRLAKLFGVARRDVGYAGLKDRHAVARQWFSIYLPDVANDQERLARFEHLPLLLLESARHLNKLRRGHLAGNHFVIAIRQVEPAAVLRARQALTILQARGVPNVVGAQRFGYRGVNQDLGKALLLGNHQDVLDGLLGRPRPWESEPLLQARQAYEAGDFNSALTLWPQRMHYERQALNALRQGRTPAQAVSAIDPVHRDYLLTSLQSAIFNQVLEERMAQNLFDRLVEGDLAWKHDNGAVFAVDAATAALENGPAGRVAALQVSPSGPLVGPKMTQPAGQVLFWEQQALTQMGLSLEDFQRFPRGLPGARRPLRVPISDPQVSAGSDEHGPFIRVSFTLPPGAFATTVLAEIIKPPAAGAPGSADAPESPGAPDSPAWGDDGEFE